MAIFAPKQRPVPSPVPAGPVQTRLATAKPFSVKRGATDLKPTATTLIGRPDQMGDVEEQFSEPEIDSRLPVSSASVPGWNFTRTPVHSLPAPEIQRKLIVNTPGDEYEQEADRVAEQVMRSALPSSPITPRSTTTNAVKRKCSRGSSCEKCREGCEDEQDFKGKKIQRKSANSNIPGSNVAAPVVNEVLGSLGQPLDRPTRAFMEPRFGYDFSGVRVHTDASAQLSARKLNAEAYVSGQHMVFGAGQFSPSTTGGRNLLAHELTHVLQQSGHAPPIIQRKGKGPAHHWIIVRQLTIETGISGGGEGKALTSDGPLDVNILVNHLSPGTYSMGKTLDDPTWDAWSKISIGSSNANRFIYSLPPGVATADDMEIVITPITKAGAAKLSPRERLARLPAYIRKYVTSHPRTRHTLDDLREMAEEGEDLVNNGVSEDDLKLLILSHGPKQPMEISGHAPEDAALVKRMREGGFDDFPSYQKFAERLAKDLRADKQSIWTPEAAAAYWREFPEQAEQGWEAFVDPKYDRAVAEDAAAWRVAFRRIDTAAAVVHGIAYVTIAVSGAFVALEVAATEALDLGIVERLEKISGVKFALLAKWVGSSLLASKFVKSLIERYNQAESSDAGTLATVTSAMDDTLDLTKPIEAFTDKELLSGRPLNRSISERVTSGLIGTAESTMTVASLGEFTGVSAPTTPTLPKTRDLLTAGDEVGAESSSITKAVTPAGSSPALSVVEDANQVADNALASSTEVNPANELPPEVHPRVDAADTSQVRVNIENKLAPQAQAVEEARALEEAKVLEMQAREMQRGQQAQAASNGSGKSNAGVTIRRPAAGPVAAPTGDSVPATPAGGPMRAPPGGGPRAGMSSTDRTLTPHAASTPEVTTLDPRSGPHGAREGAYSVGPDTPAPVSSIIRKQPNAATQRQIMARAGYSTDPVTGNLLVRDANTGRPLRVGVDPIHWGHAPEYQFAPMRDWAESQGWTQEQFDEFYNDADKWQIEYGPNNLSKVFDTIPRQKPVN